MSDSGQGAKNVKKEVLTTFEASRYLNVAPKTVSNWIDAGHLKAYRTVGGHRRIRREDLEAFISAQQSGRRMRTGSQRRRILVVEHEPAVVEAIVQALRDVDPPFDLDTAQSGFEAGVKLAEFSPDLVIVDLSIPGARAAEMFRQIRSRPASRETKILGLASASQPDLVEEGVRQGAHRCFSKPLDAAQLKREVVLLLGEI